MAELSTDDGSVPSRETIENFEMSHKLTNIEGAMRRVGWPPDEEEEREWDLEQLSESLEAGDMVRVIYQIGEILNASQG